MKKRAKAFTLMELLIVLTIMAIVTAITVPSISGYVKNSRIKNCQTQLNSLYDEILQASDSQRFYNTERYNNTVWNTVSNHIEGEKVYDISENTPATSLSTPSNSSQKIQVENICPNGGVYEIEWTVTNNDKTKVTSATVGIKINCTGKTCQTADTSKNIDKSFNIAFKGISLPEDVYEIMKSSAVYVYNKVQEYVVNNMMSTTKSNNDWYQFITDTAGLLGKNENNVTKFFRGYNEFGKSNLFSVDGNIIASGNICTEYDTIFAITVNPDTGVVEYFSYYSVYDNSPYLETLNKYSDNYNYRFYANFVIIKNESSNIYKKDETAEHIANVKSDFEMKVTNESCVITEPFNWESLEKSAKFKEPPYEGNLGSWFTKLSLKMDNAWDDKFGTEFTESLPNPANPLLSVTYAAGMVARIGNFNSASDTTRKPLYQNKTWYIQDSVRKNNKIEYNKRLLKSSDLIPVSYLSSIQIIGDITANTDLKKLKITATYADGDTRTISYSENFHIGDTKQGNDKNKGCGINGFYFTDTIEELSADNAYKISVVNPKRTTVSTIQDPQNPELTTEVTSVNENEPTYLEYDSSNVLKRFYRSAYEEEINEADENEADENEADDNEEEKTEEEITEEEPINTIYLVYAEKGYVNKKIKTCYYYITLTRLEDGTISVAY
jgi:prepilin-type N-terminal cleavage/methylation domain-containing protein